MSGVIREQDQIFKARKLNANGQWWLIKLDYSHTNYTQHQTWLFLSWPLNHSVLTPSFCICRDKAMRYLRKGCKNLKSLSVLYCKAITKWVYICVDDDVGSLHVEINSSKVVDMIETKISKNRIAKTMFYQGLGLFMSILGSVFKNMEDD